MLSLYVMFNTKHSLPLSSPYLSPLINILLQRCLKKMPVCLIIEV